MTSQLAATRLRIAAGCAAALGGSARPATPAVVDRSSCSVLVSGPMAARSSPCLPSVLRPGEGWPDAAPGPAATQTCSEAAGDEETSGRTGEKGRADTDRRAPAEASSSLPRPRRQDCRHGRGVDVGRRDRWKRHWRGRLWQWSRGRR